MSSQFTGRARVVFPVVSFVGLLALLVFVLPAVNPHPTSFSAAQATILQEAQTAAVPESYCTPPLCLAWSTTESNSPHSVAWRDVDGDGNLERTSPALATGSFPTFMPQYLSVL